MHHWLAIGLIDWGLLSLPLCLMFGRMFRVASDTKLAPSLYGDDGHAEFSKGMV
jgi:hypothetical protein